MTGVQTCALPISTETQKAPPRWSELSRVRELLSGDRVDLIANGGVKKHSDIDAIRRATGIDDVMIGTAALENASIFAPDPIDHTQVIQRFLRKCVETCNPSGTSKWVVLQMLLCLPRSKKDPELIAAVSKARSLLSLCTIFGLGEYFRSKPHRQEEDAATSSCDEDGESPPKKRNVST